MATETRMQDAVMAESNQTREAQDTFSVEEIELACDEPVTVYGRMQP